ncbi:MAG: biotin--[acetyl-CoA-carboxylase] ligase, partial [Candidatus Hodarchaeales archaeon]
IVTKTQTRGRGQRGRTWESPNGGLWTSLAIRPQNELKHLAIVPILSAVGIAKALESFDIRIMLKWPNDLIFKDNLRKIGGILVEGSITQFSIDYLIIGIGINVNTVLNQYSLSLRSKITTILEEYQVEINLLVLLKRIIFQIEECFSVLKNQGISSLLREWKKRDSLLGKKVIIKDSRRDYRGTVAGISPNGQLILNTSKSGEFKISTGTVILINN